MEWRQCGSRNPFSLLSTATNIFENIYSHHFHKLVSFTSAQGGLIINTASAAGIIFGDQDPALVSFEVLDPDLQCDSHRNAFELSKSQSN